MRAMTGVFLSVVLSALTVGCAGPSHQMPPGHQMPPSQPMPPGHRMPSGQPMSAPMPGMTMPGAGTMSAMAGGAMAGMQGMDPSMHIHMPYLRPEKVDLLYRFRVATEPARPVAGQETLIHVYVLTAAGNPVETLQVHHERLAHFLLVSGNLEEFHHLHPEDFGLLTDEARREGRFSFRVTFGTGGRYLLGVDAVDNMMGVHKDLELLVDGPTQGPTRWRLARDRQADGVESRLVTSPWQPEAARLVVGTLQLSSAGEPVTDLKPYLGALTHLAIFREGASASAHNHGGGPEFAPFLLAQPIPGYSGPKIYFEHTFPQAGRYRVFSQFQRGDTVYTVPFDVEVEARRVESP